MIEKSHTYFQVFHQSKFEARIGRPSRPSRPSRSSRSDGTRTGQTEDWHLASQLKTDQVHQVAMPCIFSYYYKRVTFYEMIKKSHTYF